MYFNFLLNDDHYSAFFTSPRPPVLCS
jgi:hypothetical protein